MGPYQPKLTEYPKTESGRQYHRFQYTWFDQFPWLEYSPSKDAIFCFPCFLFENKVPCGCIKMGPYQPKLAEYPRTESGRQYHQFQYTWFD